MEVIKVNHLCKKYKDVLAVKDISFSVRVGKELGKLGFERKLLHRGVGYNVVKIA